METKEKHKKRHLDGKELRKAIVRRLEFEGQGDNLYDSIILRRITALTCGELNQIVSFGYVTEWNNEELEAAANLEVMRTLPAAKF